MELSLIESLYNNAMSKPREVLDIFNNFFGEEYVDMQGFKTLEEAKEFFQTRTETASSMNSFLSNGFILVWFPHVRITNENDRYVDINDLYAKISIDTLGRMIAGFTLNRSNYSLLHMRSNYMHSHISSIPFNNFEEFQRPCTGSGPINHTITSLNRDFDPDIWNLFCLELSKYVTVESLAGVPYNRLENIGVARGYENSLEFNWTNYWDRYSMRFSISDLAKFTIYLIKSDIIKLNYINGSYAMCDSDLDIRLKVSKVFIEWYNKKFSKGEAYYTLDDLLSNRILLSGIVSNGKFISGNNNIPEDYSSYVGKLVCKFKGRNILLSISGLEDNSMERNRVLLLNTKITNYIFTKIFNVINYKYGREVNNSTDSTDKKIRFI